MEGLHNPRPHEDRHSNSRGLVVKQVSGAPGGRAGTGYRGRTWLPGQDVVTEQTEGSYRHLCRGGPCRLKCVFPTEGAVSGTGDEE